LRTAPVRGRKGRRNRGRARGLARRRDRHHRGDHCRHGTMRGRARPGGGCLGPHHQPGKLRSRPGIRRPIPARGCRQRALLQTGGAARPRPVRPPRLYRRPPRRRRGSRNRGSRPLHLCRRGPVLQLPSLAPPQRERLRAPRQCHSACELTRRPTLPPTVNGVIQNSGTTPRSYCQPRRCLVIRARERTGLPETAMRPSRPNNGAIKLVAGNSNPALAQAIAAYLATPLTKAVVRRFADMEIFVEIQENVRGTDVFVIQSTSYPANDHLMELLIIIDALRRASGRRVTAVIPYFGYA